MTTIGIIGGTGLYELDALESVRQINMETPFGTPSDALVTGILDGIQLIFIPRHGRGHRLSPSEVPYRANLFVLKSMGAQWVISVSAVGSMREEIKPGHVVIPDQFIDRTRSRPNTFFDRGIVAHIGFADPICSTLAETLATATRACEVPCHTPGTYLCMEGPAFSTRAESRLYRQWGVEVIGMTGLPEAKLAREAELHYATLALVTDYDCWHTEEDDVGVQAVIDTLHNNAANVRRILERAVPMLSKLDVKTRDCPCHSALANAIMTSPDQIPEEQKEALAPIVGRYLSEREC